MARWSVSIPLNATCYVEVEAETEEEAIEKGLDEADITLCHYCSEHIEIDGESFEVMPTADKITD